MLAHQGKHVSFSEIMFHICADFEICHMAKFIPISLKLDWQLVKFLETFYLADLAMKFLCVYICDGYEIIIHVSLKLILLWHIIFTLISIRHIFK